MDIKDSIFERIDCDKDHEHASSGRKKCPTSWWARIRYIDPETNKPRDLQRRATSRNNAIDIRDALKNEVKDTAGQSVGLERKTFADLCDYYLKNFVKDAQYVGDRKVSGLRSPYTVRKQVEMLREHFGPRLVRSITHGALRQFREHRFTVPTKAGGQRTIATVNREMALLRRMLNVALAEGWIIGKNPFKNSSEKLITLSDETRRERILTADEERALLAACDAPKRLHLKPILIAALDTGCRRGELLKLKWQDVSFETGEIAIRAFNTKTAKARTVAMTTRLRVEIERLWAESPQDPRFRVFGGLDSVKRSFDGARRDAGIPELRFHDLRHTNATRIEPHLSRGELMGHLGHVQSATTDRYVNRKSETPQRVAAVLDQILALPSPATETINEMVN